MKNLKFKNYAYVFVVFSAIISIILAWKKNINLGEWKNFISLIPQVVTLDVILFEIFKKWGWKFKFFRNWLVTFPNINGTWIGYIHSDWKNPETGECVDPIPTMLTVYQTFTHLSCTMYTDEMKSYSASEGFNIDPEKQIKQLSYIYTSNPRAVLSERSNQHIGAMVFDIVEKKERKLKGDYWTNRKTKGEIILEFYSKELLEQLPSDIEKHPVTENFHARD